MLNFSIPPCLTKWRSGHFRCNGQRKKSFDASTTRSNSWGSPICESVHPTAYQVAKKSEWRLRLSWCLTLTFFFWTNRLPTLDPTTASQVVDLIHQWKGTAKTIVTATHQLDIVEDIADRAVVLEKGTIIADASPSEILSNL